jgi:hypothetical protein
MENKSYSIEKKNLLIGMTGSVATIRITQLVDAFKEKFNLKFILTEKAKIFSDSLIVNYEEYMEKENIKIYFDQDETDEWQKNKIVLHIEVRLILKLVKKMGKCCFISSFVCKFSCKNNKWNL